MTPEAVLQPLLEAAYALGWNWLWLLLLIPLFIAWRATASARAAAKKRARDVQQRRDKLARVQARRRSRVIAIVHREETPPGFPFPVRGMIRQDDAEQVLAAIRATPPTKPLDIILHTPGGFVLPALQIARAIKAHPARKTVFVPHLAMSGGTLIALAADEIVLGEFSVLGPIDPQIAGLPAASLVKVRQLKPAAQTFDLTLVLADVGEKALAQVKRGAVELLTPQLEQAAAEELAEKLAGGYWTHDYALTATEAKALGLTVKVGMPQEVLELMKLYPQPVQRTGVEFLPIDLPRNRRL